MGGSIQTQIYNKFLIDKELKYLPLVSSPTPTYRLKKLGKFLGHEDIFIKREDKTSELYGGNKVRNLEYILGYALDNNYKKLITTAPLGSNFTAALTSESKRLGIECYLTQFQAEVNPQILAIDQFCRRHDGNIYLRKGQTGMMKAIFKMGEKVLFDKKILYVSPGASSVLGALGHTKALIEFSKQGKIPDYIVLGIGTCGTTAGLLAGIKFLGLKTRIIAVRCAHPIVCNERRVKKLAKKVLKLINCNGKISDGDFKIVDLALSHKYGSIAKGSSFAMKVFEEEEIYLDTTYTAKVGIYLLKEIREKQFLGKSILYWHTYSNKAYTWTQEKILTLEKL